MKPKPRRGRPALAPDDPSVSVHLRLPSSQYDELYARARAERSSVAEVIREAVRPKRKRAPTV
jgi:hypothetical protein